MSTEALVPTTPAELQSADQTMAMAGFGDEVVINNIVLVQGTTRDEAAISGNFFSKDTGANFPEVFAVPILTQTKRVLYADKSSFDKPTVLCRSNDGLVPAPGVLDRKSASCKTCAFGPILWQRYTAAKKRGITGKALRDLRPPCDERLELIFLDRFSMKVYRLNVGGGAISEVRKKMKQIAGETDAYKAQLMIRKAMGEEIKPQDILGFDDFVIHMKPVKIINNDGTFYSLRIELKKNDLKGEAKAAFRSYYQAKATAILERRRRGALAEEHTEVEAEYMAEMPGTETSGVQTPTPATTVEPTIEY